MLVTPSESILVELTMGSYVVAENHNIRRKGPSICVLGLMQAGGSLCSHSISLESGLLGRNFRQMGVALVLLPLISNLGTDQFLVWSTLKGV